MTLASWLDKVSSAEKNVVDVGSISLLAGVLADMLPAVAAVLTIVWTFIRIYETKTVQRILRCKRRGKNG